MEKIELVERAKIYLNLFNEGIHPVTGETLPEDSAYADEKVKRCFSFILKTLDEYVELLEKVEKLENESAIPEKQSFTITREQCENIKLSKEPLTVISFMKNINAVIDTNTTEKLSSTRVNAWLCEKGLVKSSKVKAVVNKTVYRPTEFANKLGLIEEETADIKTGEIKTQLKLGESAQLFIIENLENIIATT